jgi:hypothetical protein
VASDHELPPGVDLARDDVAADPVAAEQRGIALLATSAQAIIDGVEEHAEQYILRRSIDVFEAWGRTPAVDQGEALAQLRAAAHRAAVRVLDELRALFASDAAQQRRTPLEIVRTLRREPSAVLAAFGVPGIVRDAFEERALPDDLYGLAPHTFADVGDADLGAMLLAWGVGKATVLRARAANDQIAQSDVDNLLIDGAGTPSTRSSLGTITSRALHAVRMFTRRGRARGRTDAE